MNVSAQRVRASWKGLGQRFVFGGSVSVLAAVVAVLVSPLAGGILLAFPTILPAALTLLEKHEGKTSSVSDISGAVFGAFGMIAFAVVLVTVATRIPGALALLAAAITWLLVASGAYLGLHTRFRWRREEQAETHEQARGQSSHARTATSASPRSG